MRLTAVCVAPAALTLLLVDTQVYQVFKFHINPLVWDILLQQSQSKSELSWSYLFVAFPAFLLLELVITSYSIHYTKLYECCQAGSGRRCHAPLPASCLV